MGGTLNSGLLAGIDLKRSPLFLTVLNIGNGSDQPDITVEIKQPNAGSVQSGVRKLVDAAAQAGVAQSCLKLFWSTVPQNMPESNFTHPLVVL